MQNIISEIAEGRNLPVEAVAELAERAFSQALTATLGVDAYAAWDDEQLQLWRFCPDRGQVPIREASIRKKVVRRIRYELDRLLAGEVVRDELAELRRSLHSVVPGKIRAFSEKGVVVDLTLPRGGSVTAFCPAHSLGTGDLPKYGRTMLWYISSVSLRSGNRVEVILSRRSKEYVAGLVKLNAEKYGVDLGRFRVTKRIPGKYVEIEAEQVLPQSVMLAVKSDLPEHVKVKHLKGSKHGKPEKKPE